MEILISLLVQIISGAIGGNLAGMTNQSMGTSGLNSLIGGVGGLVLGQLLSWLLGAPTGDALNVAALGSNIIGGGFGGLVLTFVVGFIKNKMAAK